MGKYKKGVRVRLIEDHDHSAKAGMIGTIVDKVPFGDRDVVFEGFAEGHSGNADDGSTNHWYVPKSKLEVIVEEPSTGLPVAVGDRVRLTADNEGYGVVGDTGVVIEADAGNEDSYVRFDRPIRGRTNWYVAWDRMEKVATDAWEPKVGDRVRSKENNITEYVVDAVRETELDVTALNKDGSRSFRYPGSERSLFSPAEPLPVAAEAQPAGLWAPVVGKYGKTRSGEKVGPMEVWDGMTSYPDGGLLYHAPDDKKHSGDYWRASGENADGHSVPNRHFDLVAEWTEADEPVVAVEEVAIAEATWRLTDAKPGDTVRCDEWGGSFFTTGKEYTVTPDGNLISDGGGAFSLRAVLAGDDRWSLVTTDAPQPTASNDNTITLTLKVDSEPVADALRTIAAALSKAADEIAA